MTLPESVEVNLMKRFWRLQLSMRAALAVMLLMSIWLAWVASGAQRQRAAIKRVREFGGAVLYDYQVSDEGEPTNGEPALPAWLLNWLGRDLFYDVAYLDMLGIVEGHGSHNGSHDIKDVLREFPALRTVTLFYTQATDSCLREVGKLPAIRSIILEEPTYLTDKGVADLARAKSLRHIHMSGARFSDEALRSLGELPELKSLSIKFGGTLMLFGDLRRDAITDAGLAHLCQLTKLRELSLRGVQLSDAGISHLRELKQLESVNLDWTKVSPAAKAELLDAVSKAAEIRLEEER